MTSAVAIPETPVTAEELAPGALSSYAAEMVPIHRRQAGLPDRQEWVMLAGIANTLAASEMLPKGLQGRPNNCLAVILKGRDLGLSPTESVWGIHMIEGMPTLAAHTMSALIKRAGHRLWYADTSRERAVICAERLERYNNVGEPVYGPTIRVEWTIEDAITANLVKRLPDGSLEAKSSQGKKLPWMLYPAAMLRARALTALARMEFADVLMGAWYSPEELGAEVDEQGKVTRLPSGPEASQAFESLMARTKNGGEEQQGEPVHPPQAAVREGEELSSMVQPDAPPVVDAETGAISEPEPATPPTREELWAELEEQARLLAGGSVSRHTARAVVAYKANAEDWTDEQLAEFVASRRGSYQRYKDEHPEEAVVAPTATADPEVEVKPEDEKVAEESGAEPQDEPATEPGEQRDSGLDGVEGDGLPGSGGGDAATVTSSPSPADPKDPSAPSGPTPVASPTEGDPATKREDAAQDTLDV